MSLEMILENKRDSYLIQVLEEGTTELESLKTKKYLTENLETIRKILIEEGLLDTLKNHGGKIAAGIGLGAAATYAGTHEHALDDAKEAVGNGVDKVKKMYSDATDTKPETTEVHKDTPEYKQTHITDKDGSQNYIKKLHGGHLFSNRAEADKYLETHKGAFDPNNKNIYGEQHTQIPSNGPVNTHDTSGIEKDAQKFIKTNDPTHVKSTSEIANGLLKPKFGTSNNLFSAPVTDNQAMDNISKSMNGPRVVQEPTADQISKFKNAMTNFNKGNQ
jgi:hypothetical protein